MQLSPLCPILLILLLSLMSYNGNGQDYIDLVKLGLQATPNYRFKSSKEQTRVSEYTGELTIPVPLSEMHTWFTNIVYERVVVKLYEAGEYQNLNSLTLRTGLSIRHSPKLIGTYLAVPRLSTVSERNFAKGFQMGGLVLFKFNRSERTNFKAGLFMSSEFFSPFITPLLGYYRLSADGRWEVNALLPSSCQLNRKLSDRWDAGLNFVGQIKGYRLSQVPGTGRSGYVARSSNEICTYLKWRMAKNVFAQARVGFSVGRTYRVYNADDKLAFAISFIKFNNTRTQLNTDFANGPVGQFSLFYRIPTR